MCTISRRALLKAAGALAMSNSPFLRAADSLGGTAGDEVVTPFRFHADQDALDDLRRRLEHTRLPERETSDGWSEGVPLANLHALIKYWHTRYDWRRCESELNSFPQYRTTIDGLNIHFLHVGPLIPTPCR
jgi:epoxide hydrolase